MLILILSFEWTNGMPDTTDRLFDLLSHPNFLEMKGLANEVPIFIHAYDAKKEDEARLTAEHLTLRLRNAGIAVALHDLFDVLLEKLEKENRLQRILDRELSVDKPKMLDLLRNISDPSTALVPYLMNKLKAENVRLTLLTGAGRVFPFLRTHSILEALQPAMTRHPIILFFPGDYVQEDNGSHLRLFGKLTDTPLSQAYYRAFNLAYFNPIAQ